MTDTNRAKRLQAHWAERVRESMRKQSISQSQLSKRSGLHQTVISKLLAGKIETRTEHMSRIADALGDRTLAWLFDPDFPTGESLGAAVDAAARDSAAERSMSDPADTVPTTREQFLAAPGEHLTDDERAALLSMRFSTPVGFVPDRYFWKQCLHFVRKVLARSAQQHGGGGGGGTPGKQNG